MKHTFIFSLFILSAILLASCTENLDPLSPGSTNGEYSLGIKALVPLAVGNTWTYNVTVYDTAGAQKSQFTCTLSVKDTVTADTSKIPLSSAARKSLTRGALVWYLLQGESGATSCWQVDSLEVLRIRKSDDMRFFEQSAFDFRASIGDVTPLRYVGKDTVVWASGDRFIYNADSVKSALVSKGADTLRTTLGSAPYFQYKESYALRADYTNYYFKPGFGLFLVERYQRTPGGKMFRARRDELTAYCFK
ncbi:MAG: hypothetical protein NTZ35_01860 [Ignavibacteriales bacterium]|nr:hypothetical protein [Ignavibacteriales bacterium]